ncbi:hypothetical protein SISNIDRAFT_450898 [Sistotremastrum niveocremeum HHB9708]|uniref:Uncharacterized protein n=2 Tax=Sistotremastraceae TaxID=3402574 RepID=A0A164XSH0_9AGAM|nr:hypothetical protein SISNIDRAFT_450898 [Sistotremastrum niveocremeum HHB9708]KZT34778.1 hypothetical protein SISSUDRAFT_1052352 [Sistotremastrum suecicum HHB10207 ss-3]
MNNTMFIPRDSNVPPKDIRTQHALEWVFTALLVIGGQVGLPILLASFLFVRTAVRSLVVNSFCFTWIVYSISYCLLLYTSRSDKGTADIIPTNDELCLFQAALINGSQAMTAVSTLGMVINLWLILNRPAQPLTLKRSLLLASPAYVVFVAFFVGAYVAGAPAIPEFQAANSAIPGPFYCFVVENGPLTNSPTGVFRTLISVYVFAAVIHGFIFGLECAIFYTLFKKRRDFREPLMKETFTRVGIFTVYRIISIIMMAFLMHDPESLLIEGLTSPRDIYDGYAEIVAAAGPLVVFINLATRRDVRTAWHLLLPTEKAAMKKGTFDLEAEARAKNDVETQLASQEWDPKTQKNRTSQSDAESGHVISIGMDSDGRAQI